jgi:hypothetical protein
MGFNFRAFLEGFTGGSIFSPAKEPGAPTQLFADSHEEVGEETSSEDLPRLGSE